MSRAALAAAIATGCACAACDDTNWEIVPSSLELGTVYAGWPFEASFQVVNRGPAGSAWIEAPAPLQVDPGAATLGRGESATVRLRGVLTGGLRPGAAVVVRDAAGRSVAAPLAVQVRAAPPCERPACHELSVDAAGTCVQTPVADGTGCESACASAAACTAGTCAGTAISCDDGDPCTLDACAEPSGCFHLDATAGVCPAAGPCRRATCDPTGCGEEAVPDGAPCGPRECETASVCVAGECVQRPAPGAPGCAQPGICDERGWCWEWPAPLGAELLALRSGGPGEVVAVGRGGLVLERRAGRWEAAPTRVASHLHALFPGPDGALVAAGSGGTLVVRRDGRWGEAAGPDPGATLVAGAFARGEWWLAASDSRIWRGAPGRWAPAPLPRARAAARVHLAPTPRGVAAVRFSGGDLLAEWDGAAWKEPWPGLAPVHLAAGDDGTAWVCGGGPDGPLVAALELPLARLATPLTAGCLRVWPARGALLAVAGPSAWLLRGDAPREVRGIRAVDRVAFETADSAWIAGSHGRLARWATAEDPPAPPEADPAWQVAGLAADDVWAAGRSLRHFDGRAWRAVLDADTLRVVPLGARRALAFTARADWLEVSADGGEPVPFLPQRPVCTATVQGGAVRLGWGRGEISGLEDGQMRQIIVSEGAVDALLSPEPAVLFAAAGGDLFRLDGERISEARLTTLARGLPCRAFALGHRAGALHALGARGDGLCLLVCDAAGCREGPVPPGAAPRDAPGSPALYVRGELHADEDGTLWAATGGAVLRLDGDRWITEFAQMPTRSLWGAGRALWAAGDEGLVRRLR